MSAPADARRAGPPAGPGWRGTTKPLLQLHDVLLLDLDGVVYIGEEPVRGAPQALAKARSAGVRLAFVTNNAARTATCVAEHLTRIGVAATAADVVTSAQAASMMLAHQLEPGARVLVVGGEGLVEAVAAAGLTPVTSADDEPVAVVQGFAPQVDWQMLLEACVGVRAGLPWVATNGDLTIPTPRGPAPGNGALVDVVRRTTGVDPAMAGKPFRPIMDEAVRRTGASRALVVGDRLDTDIEGAAAADLPSLLVLTGIDGVRALLAAPPAARPTYLGVDLDDLSRPAPDCTPFDGGWRCAGVSAVARQGSVEVVNAGPSGGRQQNALDAVRAVCSLVWASEGEVDPGRAAAALSVWTAPHGWDR